MQQTANPSLQQLRRETEQRRTGLTQTVEQLKRSVSETASDLRQRISPEAIKAEVADYVRFEIPLAGPLDLMVSSRCRVPAMMPALRDLKNNIGVLLSIAITPRFSGAKAASLRRLGAFQIWSQNFQPNSIHDGWRLHPW